MSADDLSEEDGKSIEKVANFLAYIWNKANGNVSDFFGYISGMVDKFGMPDALMLAMIRFCTEMHFEEFKHTAPDKILYALQQVLECVNYSACVYNFPNMITADESGISIYKFFPKYDADNDVTDPKDIAAQLRFIDRHIAELQQRKADLLKKVD